MQLPELEKAEKQVCNCLTFPLVVGRVGQALFRQSRPVFAEAWAGCQDWSVMEAVMAS